MSKGSTVFEVWVKLVNVFSNLREFPMEQGAALPLPNVMVSY